VPDTGRGCRIEGWRSLSARWLDKLDNPGMANWKPCNEDVYGAVMLVNFAAMAYRAAMTRDFVHLHPVVKRAQLTELEWLDSPRRPAGRKTPS
jgi:hypothetical protein